MWYTNKHALYRSCRLDQTTALAKVVYPISWCPISMGRIRKCSDTIPRTTRAFPSHSLSYQTTFLSKMPPRTRVIVQIPIQAVSGLEQGELLVCLGQRSLCARYFPTRNTRFYGRILDKRKPRASTSWNKEVLRCLPC